MKKLFSYIFLCLALLFFCCKKLERDNPLDNKYNSGGTTSSLSVTTISISSITQTSAVSGGNITNDGGSDVISRGVCYSVSPNPTTSNSVIYSGSGTGSFTLNISGLSSNTTYYVRAFAINTVENAYGNEVDFTTSQLPNNTCNVTAKTTGTTFAMQTPSQSFFNQGDSYTITMYSSIYSFGQASSVDLYDNNAYINSFGSYVTFANSTKTFILPSSIPTSNCFNIRVYTASETYVSLTFTIVP